MKSNEPFRKTPDHRYQTDPVFANLVNMLESCLHRADCTQDDIRDAATLACIRHAMRNPRPMYIDPNGHILDSFGEPIHAPAEKRKIDPTIMENYRYGI